MSGNDGANIAVTTSYEGAHRSICSDTSTTFIIEGLMRYLMLSHRHHHLHLADVQR